jgi:hypothetical protein
MTYKTTAYIQADNVTTISISSLDMLEAKTDCNDTYTQDKSSPMPTYREERTLANKKGQIQQIYSSRRTTLHLLDAKHQTLQYTPGCLAL